VRWHTGDRTEVCRIEDAMNRVLVFGATGNVGRPVVSQLVAAGAPVRAMSRSPDSAGLPLQVEVMRGDFNVPESLDRCLSGIETVFLVWSGTPAAVGPALERITKHARRIVFLSAPLKTRHPFFQQPNPLRVLFEQIEQRIESSGLEWIFLRPGMFASNALGWWSPQIRSGDVVHWPFAEFPSAPIHEKDIAAVAVRALCDGGHAGADYVLTGPQSLTHAEQVSTIGRVLGRPLRFEEISPEQWRQECAGTWPPAAVNMLLDAWGAAIGHPALVTTTVADITGARARTFLAWAGEHASQFRS